MTMRCIETRRTVGVARGRRSFTLVELIVVIVIIAIVLTLAIPAFSSILYSSTQALAQNAMELGVRAARDAAVRSGASGDTAAAFFYEPGGRLSIVVYEEVGEIADPNTQGESRRRGVRRSVFAPVRTADPVQLPPGWMIRGAAPIGSVIQGDGSVPGEEPDSEWYGTQRAQGARTSYVFPETGFFDRDAQDDGRDRQTFVIRFEGGTGAVSPDTGEMLLISPRPSVNNRVAFGAATKWKRVDQEADPRRWATRVIAETKPGGALFGKSGERELEELIGDLSGDTVLAKPVPQLVLYEERRLAEAMGARRVNLQTKCLYKDAAAQGGGGRDIRPEWDDRLFPDIQTTQAGVLAERTADWFEGRLSSIEGTGVVETDARVFAVHPFYGSLVEVTR